MASLLPPGHCTTNSLAISFLGEIMTYWRDYDVITREFPAKNWGNPLEITNFGRFRLVMCMPITLTIPVLFKTSIKASPHPLPHHPPHPHHCPTPTPPIPYRQPSMCWTSFGHFQVPPQPPPPTPWVCPPHKHTNNFCID